MTGVYLLHFVPRFKHAGHYLGYADDIGRRVYEHEFGQSDVKLITAAVKAGVQFKLARTWEGGDRTLERKLKGTKGPGRTGSLARLCPICKEEKKHGKAKSSTALSVPHLPPGDPSPNGT